MSRKELQQIPELQIFPNELIEDAFYYKMAKAGRLTDEQGKKAFERLKSKVEDPCYSGAFLVADMMIANLDKYGVPCVAWCK